MGFEFKPGVKPPLNRKAPAIWFAYSGDQLIILEDSQGIMLPQTHDFEQLGMRIDQRHYLGVLNDQHCYAITVPTEQPLPVGYRSTDIRWLIGQCDEALFQIAGRAKQIIEWEATHQYCGRCGSPMQMHDEDRAKVCSSCGLTQYPRIAPCIICLVTREDEVLLARSPNFPPQVFSTLAGFVEAGESIEEAVHREIDEEVGIQVKNVRYFGSQPWPFPNSLMIGFHAEYANGEIAVDGKEIVDARWWKLDALPVIPPVGSISRQLIDAYLETMNVKVG